MTTSKDSQKINVLLFGLGAIGSFYAFILSKNENATLSVIARSNYEAVKRNGLQIESKPHGNHKVRIDHVLKSPSEATGPFDFIICSHKAISPASTPPLFKDLVTPLTTFVIIQNGVGNEDPFRALYPTSPIISCVTWVGAVQSSPGFITHNGNEDMQIGLFPNSDPANDEDRLSLFATLLRNGGTIFQISPNVQKERWEKVVWNAAWNPLTTLTAVPVQTWLSSSDESLNVTKQLMREVIDVGRKCGVPLEYELVDQLIEKVLAMPSPIFSSMYVDSKEGRALEVDVILGTPMRRARELGMDVPVLRTIYGLTMAVNQRLVADR